MKLRSRHIAMAALALCAWLAGCGPSGTPGISGEVVLGDNSLVNNSYATRVFIGAYTDQQLDGDWPRRWGDAGFSATIENVNAKPYRYEIVTGTAQRLHVYAFLDQNGKIAGNSATEPDALQQDTAVIPDLMGLHARNPVTPIDDILQDIDIVLKYEAN
ncbi:MAG: hypothetical protein JXR83_07500 [Deltaproteobacteria bacterium]|nr:hypothetical protein [Deltaproteobacteria bacterium]